MASPIPLMKAKQNMPAPERTSRTEDSKLVNPYVFLVGCPRSGTTMLKRMVNAHPMVAITRETHWIPRTIDKQSREKQRGITPEGYVTEHLIDKLFEHHRFEQMKISREKLLSHIRSNPKLTYAELVSHIFDQYGQRKLKPLVGDKTPTYVRKIPTLHALWPDTRFVHLVRDGRDVWLSIKDWRMAEKSAGKFASWHVDPLVTTALWWKALVGMGRRDGALLGEDQYREIQFQDLVSHPDVVCRQLAHFLRLPHVEAMERFYEGRTQHDSDLSTNAAWLPPTPGRRNWKTQMEPDEIERFEAAAGDLLDELGYERACPQISNQVQQEVDVLKNEFASAVNGRWQLPQPW